METPTRKALRDDSPLKPLVADGMGAIENRHREHFEASVRATFSDSIDIDEGLKLGRENENRWDYLLGHKPSEKVVAVEPHTANQGEVSVVIRKRKNARDQLADHLRDGSQIATWLWVASGSMQFADTEKARRLLDQNGIRCVGKILEKHLPIATPSTVSKTSRRKGR